MVSVHATSDVAPGTVAPVTGTLFTSRLARRAAPVVRTPRGIQRLGGPGQLAGRVGDFSMRLGLSHTSRWALDAQRAFAPGSTRTAPVRPPLNYWPWGDPDEAAATPEPADATPSPQRTATAGSSPRSQASRDRKLDDLRRMLGLGPLTESSSPVAPPTPPIRRAAKRRDAVVHRGLPRTLARRGGTSRGVPGDIAQRMRPQAVDPRAIGTREAAAPPPPRPQRAREASAAPASRGGDRSPAGGRASSDGPSRRPAPADGASSAVAAPSGPGRSEPIAGRAAAGAPPGEAQRTSSTGSLPRSIAEPASIDAPRPGSSTGQSSAAPTARTATARPPAAPAPAAHDPSARGTGVEPRAGNDRRGEAADPARQHVGPPTSTTGDAAPTVSRRSSAPAGNDTARPARDDPARSMPRDPARSMPRDPAPAGVQDREPAVRHDQAQHSGERDRSARPGDVARAAAQPAGRARIEPARGEAGGADAQGFRTTSSVDVVPRPPAVPTSSTSLTASSAPTRTGSAAANTATVGQTITSQAATSQAATSQAATSQATTSQATTAPAAARPTATIATAAPPTAAPPTATDSASLASVVPLRRATAREASPDAMSPTDAGVTVARRGVQPEAPSFDPRRAPDPNSSRPPDGTAQRDTIAGGLETRTTTARRPATPAVRPPSASPVASPSEARVDIPGTPADRGNGEAGRSADNAPHIAARHDAGERPPTARQPVNPAPPRPAIRRAGDIGTNISGERVESRTPTRPHGRLPAALVARPPVAGSPASMTISADDTGGPGEQRSVSSRRLASPKPVTRAARSQTSAPSSAPLARDDAGSAPTPAPARDSAPMSKAASVPISPGSTSPVSGEVPSVGAARSPSPIAKPVAGHPAAGRTSPAHRQHIARRSDAVVNRGVPGNVSSGVDVRKLPAAPPLAAAAPPSREPHAPAGGHTDDQSPADTRRTETQHADTALADTGHGTDVTAVRRRTAAEIASPAADAAARFRATLQRTPAATVPLPSRWRPLASAIVGERPVRISTGSASRAALQAAGKVAATTGDVVHLARPLRAADAPMLAHELAHVANPSPAPRFFDDHRNSPEERRAELVADVIRRSPVLPRPSAGPTAPGAPIRRAPRTAPPLASLATGRSGGLATMPAPGTGTSTTVSAAALAAAITTGATPGIQRELAGGTSRRGPSGGSFSGHSGGWSGGRMPDISRVLTDQPVDDHDVSTVSSDASNGVLGTFPMLTRGLDSTSLTDFVDWIMEQLEDRIGRELERRGGRYRGEF